MVKMADDDLIPHEVVELVYLQKMAPMKAWRKYLKLSQDAVATRIGVSRGWWARRERQQMPPLRFELWAIAHALGISTEQLDVGGKYAGYW